MAEAKITLQKEWRPFANRYGADRAYWCVPKGLAVGTDSLKPRLEVLKEFEGGSPGANASGSMSVVSTMKASRLPQRSARKEGHRSRACSNRCP